MAGIYVHIPFCRKACHYCNFHFSTSRQLENDLIGALLKEIDLRVKVVEMPVQTIYFGGGTPSLLPGERIKQVLERIREGFRIELECEITLEANPDDIYLQKLKEWKEMGINRLSIGIQSFLPRDLSWMNRAHDAEQASQSLILTREAGFSNFSIDLIFGLPGQTDDEWVANIEEAIRLQVPHLSCYALTVEPNTALKKWIETGKQNDMDTDQQACQYGILMDLLEKAGYEQYEISSFSLPGKQSRHNKSYWENKPYLGFGPSAHSYDGLSRSWNIANNKKYIEAINQEILPSEKEILTPVQQFNEYVMLSLRTSKGIDLKKIKRNWGESMTMRLEEKAMKYGKKSWIKKIDEHFILTREGKLFADGIASDLFTGEGEMVRGE